MLPAVPPSGPRPAIEVTGLVRRYGPLVAVDHLDLEVETGTTIAVLGPNGAGKTTTVECLEGLAEPDEGTVRVLGLDPRRDAGALRPRVGVMLQEGGVYPMAMPGELVRLHAAFHADPEDPDGLLDRVGLTGSRRTRYRDLSGGQKQRLSLALALVGRPDVLFLDEPTAGLDPAARRETWRLLERMKAAGVTTVLTTHLLDEAERLADRVAILDHGRLVALGTPSELTRAGSEELELTLRCDGTAIDGVATALAGALAVAVEGVDAERLRVAAGSSPALVRAIAEVLEREGATLVRLDDRRRRLEDVYLRLTGELAEQELG
ncbi:MAG: hypothetical protein RLZZ272_119 [Actinomycetota bacterium]